MIPEHRQLLIEESGSDVQWVPEEAKVMLSGAAEQLNRGKRLVARVMMHCRWGYSRDKVKRLIKPGRALSVLCRLAPMDSLKPVEKVLNQGHKSLTIGKDKQNTVVVRDPLMSRQHVVLDFDVERGAVYACDLSRNGAFLNGVKLPNKKVGKVLVSHGDELLLKDPSSGEPEFGYIINLQELSHKVETKLEAPRRLLGPDEVMTRLTND